MFNLKTVTTITKDHKSFFENLHKLEETLNNRFYGMEDAVRAMILAVASGEPLLFIGDPGTGKSRLIRVFCNVLGLLDLEQPGKDHPDYFEYLLTPFTEPNELFGYFNIAKAANSGVIERIEKNMMQQAKVVYLDEVFNASSAILNSLLAFLNEHYFHDRGEIKRAPTECIFAATNLVPETPELRAIFDRFVLRCWVHNAPANIDHIGNFLRKGWPETYLKRAPTVFYPDLLKQAKALRETIRANGQALTPDFRSDDEIHRKLIERIQDFRQYNVSQMSNRRIVKMLHIMLIHRMYAAVVAGEINATLNLRKDELELMDRYFVDRVDEEFIGSSQLHGA